MLNCLNFSFEIAGMPINVARNLLCETWKYVQVRRGADRAEIYSLAFSSTAQWLAVSSDKGTVHVFSLKVNSGSLGNDMTHQNDSSLSVAPSGSSFSFIKGNKPLSFCPTTDFHFIWLLTI